MLCDCEGGYMTQLSTAAALRQEAATWDAETRKGEAQISSG